MFHSLWYYGIVLHISYNLVLYPTLRRHLLLSLCETLYHTALSCFSYCAGFLPLRNNNTPPPLSVLSPFSIIRIPTRAQDDTPNMSHIMSSQLFPGGPHQSPPLGGNSGNELKPLSIRKANKRTCSVVGCKNGIVQGGVCISHGAKRRKCRFPGCEKNSKSAGLCSRHG
eukprot:CCRYP_014000-RA/>CCRYP_014000-RA protein AED:0.19 eAED:0.19 QI:30/-1/1/1/-1/1/1/97/168